MANKKDVHKRRIKAAQKKQEKRKAKVAVLHKQPEMQVRYRPGITEMGAPDGFRAIGMTQAVMEYGKPLQGYTGQGMQSTDDVNKLMQTSILLWNHALDYEKGEADETQKVKIAKTLSKSFGLRKDEAESLRARMVERRSYLFPPDKQPKERITPFMIMRKETHVEIRPFAYDKLISTEDSIAPNPDDNALIDKIAKLDRSMVDELEYGELEKLLTVVKDEAEQRFKKWLADKGFPQEFHRLAECLHIYFDFIYGYMHDDVVTLKSVSLHYLIEFFEDFLIRKMYVEPQEYVDWPPAIKLFYLFLKDKGYVVDSSQVITSVNTLEPRFTNILRKQFA